MLLIIRDTQYSMNDTPLLNPQGQLLPELAARMFEARKTKALWAKRVIDSQAVETLEGKLTTGSDDYLCRGITGEHWPQQSDKLFEKYVPSDQFDHDGWQRFDPRPDAAPVLAAQIDNPFRVKTHRGELVGKARDYVIRSTTDPADVWIVDRAIFEASYAPVAD